MPPWLRVQSPGCKGTQLETELVRKEGRGGRSRSYSPVRNSHLGTLQKDRRTHKLDSEHTGTLHFNTHLHLHLSGEIDHVQFPSSRFPTASFECINNSTPLHLSSLAFYTLHSSPPLIQPAAMRAPRWIPLLELLDLDEELQNEIPASLRPCQPGPVGWISPSCLMQLPATSLASSLLGCDYFLSHTHSPTLFPCIYRSVRIVLIACFVQETFNLQQ